MDSNRLSDVGRGSVEQEQEEQVSQELMERYMLKDPRQVRVGVAS